MRILIVCLLALCGNAAISQNTQTKKLLESIKGQYELSPEGHVAYSKVVALDGWTKEEIFEQARLYIVRNYGLDQWSEVQLADEAAGLIQAQGLLDTVYISKGLAPNGYGGVYSTRIEVKDGKARVSVLFTHLRTTFGASPGLVADQPLLQVFPFNQSDNFKSGSGHAFYLFHHASKRKLDQLVQELFAVNAANEW